jgi:outer membrane protein assembly factor BamA
MKKTSCILIVILFLAAGIASAKEIEEITVQGLTRSDEELVRRQLPYEIGDEWTQELKELTEKRLLEMRTFNPMTLKVASKEVGEEKVKIIIRTEDPNPFMFHPVEFGVFKVVDLTSERLTQYALNPFGKGMNFNAGVDWSSDPWWQIETGYAGSQGRTYSISYKDFTNNEEFNNLEYEETGFNLGLELQQIPTHDLTLGYTLSYQENTYQQQREVAQEYLLMGTEITYEKYGQLKSGIEYGYGLAEDNVDFSLLNLRWDKVNNLGDDKFIFSFKSGAASPNTPFNYQFKGGGTNALPFRGTEFELAGTKYLVSNLEYHKLLAGNWLWGIGFLDTGKLIPEDSKFGKTDWKLDGGGALALSTPFGPLRFDLGFDLLAEGYEFNVNLGHTF